MADAWLVRKSSFEVRDKRTGASVGVAWTYGSTDKPLKEIDVNEAFETLAKTFMSAFDGVESFAWSEKDEL